MTDGFLGLSVGYQFLDPALPYFGGSATLG
jgi:hypothetical protein